MSNVAMMRAIKAADYTSEGDDGGVEHPPVECEMPKGCAHGLAVHRCRTLGMCGCAYVYAKACEPGGYLVIRRDNPIREALTAAGMVVEHNAGSYISNHGEVRMVLLTPRA